MRGDTRVTLSKLESRFLERLQRGRATAPGDQPPRRRAPRRLPLAGPRLTVELDSYRYHHTRHAWEQDRRREREARARDDEIRRYTYGDVFESPELMMAELRALLEPQRPAWVSWCDIEAGR